ncbi:hypothetical protein [Pasteuria penetrans]|uniref:hypothetical protein n=1 Tax=Pasteuria penetrans TaxID=86005 RepID=UPI000FB8D114|nr:hypothetical protein [Pasteuria penetrans]
MRKIINSGLVWVTAGMLSISPGFFSSPTEAGGGSPVVQRSVPLYNKNNFSYDYTNVLIPNKNNPYCRYRNFTHHIQMINNYLMYRLGEGDGVYVESMVHRMSWVLRYVQSNPGLNSLEIIELLTSTLYPNLGIPFIEWDVANGGTRIFQYLQQFRSMYHDQRDMMLGAIDHNYDVGNRYRSYFGNGNGYAGNTIMNDNINNTITNNNIINNAITSNNIINNNVHGVSIPQGPQGPLGRNATISSADFSLYSASPNPDTPTPNGPMAITGLRSQPRGSSIRPGGNFPTHDVILAPGKRYRVTVGLAVSTHSADNGNLQSCAEVQLDGNRVGFLGSGIQQEFEQSLFADVPADGKDHVLRLVKTGNNSQNINGRHILVQEVDPE